jgi:hypothetical protein
MVHKGLAPVRSSCGSSQELDPRQWGIAAMTAQGAVQPIEWEQWDTEEA